ncbi:hypothetical protein VNO78_10192 [Psophocarpus tetragonolobus]|uniref:Uncharacterized protein n=1 Tax=Psophocarpus tetragonolobus TaxID=3891 RepID=A0AAN9SKV6_PSOTE
METYSSFYHENSELRLESNVLLASTEWRILPLAIADFRYATLVLNGSDLSVRNRRCKLVSPRRLWNALKHIGLPRIAEDQALCSRN